MAPCNKEIDSAFPITCSAAILETPRGRKREADFSRDPELFRPRKEEGGDIWGARNNGSLVENDTRSRYRGKWIEIRPSPLR